MRQVRDIVIALCIGVVWAMLIGQVVGYYAASSPGRLVEMDALARGDAVTFIVVALLKDVAIYAVPSLFAGYLISRLMTRPMPFALIAGAPLFLYSAYSAVRVVLEGGYGDARGIYVALNAVLLLAAIPACVALLQYSARIFPGAMSRAN